MQTFSDGEQNLKKRPLPTCRCANSSAHQVSSVTSQEEEEVVLKTRLPLSADGDDVTLECVAHNLVGESRDVFVHRRCQTGPGVLCR